MSRFNPWKVQPRGSQKLLFLSENLEQYSRTSRPSYRKMKLASAFPLTFWAAIFAAVPGIAQLHVDVPLPPYDPPPTISHHSQSRHDEPISDTEKPRTYRQHSDSEPKKATPNKQENENYSNRNHKGTKAHSTHDPSRRHRRKHLHWPWQHNK